MLITDKFAYLHQPKTGGTFVREMICRVHGVSGAASARRGPMHGLRARLADLPARLRSGRRGLGARTYRTRHGEFVISDDKHGPRENLPLRDRGKMILGSVRNPYDHYVSEYEFGWWRKPEYRESFSTLPHFESRYSHFPDLDFAEYVRLINPDASLFDRDGRHPDAIGVGALSRRFAMFYGPDAEAMRARLDDAYIACEAFRADFAGLRFLATDRLNVDLHAFLRELGYPEPDIAFILESGKVRPEGSVREDSQAWQDYYDSELKAFVRERERMLFTLFPHFEA